MVAAVYGGDRVAVPGDERCDVLDWELRPGGASALSPSNSYLASLQISLTATRTASFDLCL